MSTKVVHPYITHREDIGSGRPVIVGTGLTYPRL